MAPRWKQVKYVPNREADKQAWADHTMHCYAYVKRMKSTHITTWINLDAVMKEAKQISHRSLHVV